MPEPEPRSTLPTRRRTALAGAIGLIPLIPVLIAIAVSSGGAAAGTTSDARTVFNPVAIPKTSRAAVPGTGTLVALVEHATRMRSSPAGRGFAAIGVRTQFGSPQAFWVVRRAGGWLGVVSPQAGNNRVGWIPASAASLSRVPWRLEVSLAHRRLTVLDAGRPVERYTVAIGAPSAPTPTGRFAVTDRLLTGDPSGPYGCCILALSALAPHAIQGWTGGNRIAIHSTPETSSIGLPVSHGCLRLTIAEGRWLLAHIPLGTPALISS